MHTTVLSYPYLVLQVRVGPSSQEAPNNLVVAIVAGNCQCCPTILYGRMTEYHTRWLNNNS